jgi:tetratricopeptide (TPR) repeat protein
MKAPRAIALCQCFNGALEFQTGHWREAEAALRESIRLHREIGAASGEALACQRLGELFTARGDWDGGRAILEEGILAAERATLRAHCLVRLYAALARNRLEAGDLDMAEHALALGLERSQRHGHCASCDALLLPAVVSIRVQQGNLEEAESFCNQLEEASVNYASRIWVAIARQARAELAAAHGKLDQAVMRYHEAYENFTIAGNDYAAARCLWASSVIRLQRRAPRDHLIARDAQAKAREIYARLGVR